ncbi:MAG: hypothetical protein JWP94_2971 [Mucilaginibacter sp.]|nr:hypothetical protein [Mucilaginibacter sp.]
MDDHYNGLFFKSIYKISALIIAVSAIAAAGERVGGILSNYKNSIYENNSRLSDSINNLKDSLLYDSIGMKNWSADSLHKISFISDSNNTPIFSATTARTNVQFSKADLWKKEINVYEGDSLFVAIRFKNISNISIPFLKIICGLYPGSQKFYAVFLAGNQFILKDSITTNFIANPGVILALDTGQTLIIKDNKYKRINPFNDKYLMGYPLGTIKNKKITTIVYSFKVKKISPKSFLQLKRMTEDTLKKLEKRYKKGFL